MKPAVYSFVACGRRREVRKWSSLGPCKAKADVPAPASEKQLATCAINLNHGYMSIENKALPGFVWHKRLSPPQINALRSFANVYLHRWRAPGMTLAKWFELGAFVTCSQLSVPVHCCVIFPLLVASP